MRDRLFCGVDPGASGAIAIIDAESEIVGVIKNSATPADLSDFVWSHTATPRLDALLEQVSAMPKQGVASTFKFGASYGFLQGLLVAHGVRWQTVTPQTWQREMRCLTRGDKNVTKAAAQQLWPDQKITHATADALLLAECCRRQPLGWRCAWTSEIEPFPAAVVEHRFGLVNLGDVTKITEGMLHERETVDLLVGGTPCQSFSVAGLRRGLADARGNLALRFVQLAAVMQPKWIVWENVPGVLSSNKGRDFGTFLGALAELGYGFAYRILDAQWFGVAQRRRRVFVVCHLRDWRRAAAVLFEPESVFGDHPTRAKAWEGTSRPVASSLTSSGRGVARTGESRGQDDVVVCTPIAGTLNAGGKTARSATLQDADTGLLVTSFHPTQDPIISVDGSTHAMGCGSRSGCATHAVAFTAKDCGGDASHEVSPTMRAMGHSGSHANGGGQLAVAFAIDGGNQAASVEVHHTLRTGRDAGDAVAFKPSHYTRGKDGAPSEVTAPLTADADKGDQDTVIQQALAVRLLTPRECERLQGFPDDYTLVEYRKKPAADGPRYRALGNSMAVPVMRWIGERIAMVDQL